MQKVYYKQAVENMYIPFVFMFCMRGNVCDSSLATEAHMCYPKVFLE